MYNSLISFVIGCSIDFLAGDPHYSWHPIRLIGTLISGLEKVLRKLFPTTEKGERTAGFFLVLLTAGISTVLPLLALVLCYRWHRYAGIILESIFCWQLLATKSLRMESMKVYAALKAGDIQKSRAAVSMIVGRDTQNLSEAGITKAAVETVAENTSDGSIAPMLYMAIGGAPLGFLYKAVNTLDSMVGYKNERYLYFGRAAARTDDIMNLIPSRISAFLMMAAVFIKERFSGGNPAGYSAKNAVRIYRRDRYNHASPNSAQTEAVMAGALQVQLAGDAVYFGKRYKKKTIGDDIRPIETEDIKRANQLLYGTAALGILLFCGIKGVIIKLIL